MKSFFKNVWRQYVAPAMEAVVRVVIAPVVRVLPALVVATVLCVGTVSTVKADGGPPAATPMSPIVDVGAGATSAVSGYASQFAVIIGIGLTLLLLGVVVAWFVKMARKR